MVVATFLRGTPLKQPGVAPAETNFRCAGISGIRVARC